MQELIAFLIVLAAVVYLLRQWWPSKNKSGGCGGCSSTAKGCGSPTHLSTLPADNLIQIDTRSPKHQHKK